jgi:hypothetical protein
MLSENTLLSFRTERGEVRNPEKSECYDDQDFSLSLETTVLGQPPRHLITGEIAEIAKSHWRV